MELVEEAREEALEAACARIGCGLVGEANLTDQIGEAAGRTGGLDVVQRVGADSLWRAGLAALARKE